MQVKYNANLNSYQKKTNPINPKSLLLKIEYILYSAFFPSLILKA